MKTEITYTHPDLHHGKCECRGEESDEIVTTDDGEKCLGCIEEEKFYQQTMKGI